MYQNGPVITTSFVQNQKHQTKSDKFVAIQPSQIATVLADHGFNLVHLRSGRARLAERADHQTTIARYRSENSLNFSDLGIGAGRSNLWMDLVFKVPHLYGALEGFVGTWRQVCSNGAVVGEKYQIGKVSHIGDALNELNNLIPRLVACHDQLVDEIRLMHARKVSPSEIAQLARTIGQLRLGSGTDTTKIVNPQFQDLLKVRRQDDYETDLFTVMNVIQENVMRYGLRYQTESLDAKGLKVVRNMTARPVGANRSGDIETSRSVDMNASIWDAASALLVNAA